MGGFPLGRVRLKTKCCVSCFRHPFIRGFLEGKSSETSKCDYCGSRPRRLIPIDALAGYFHNLVSMYEESDDGDTLISLVQDGWYVFSDKLRDSGKAKELLDDILNSDWDDDSGEWPVNAFDTYRSRAVLPELESWDGFCDEVKEEPEAEPDFGEFFELELAIVEKVVPAGTVLFRARLGWATGGREYRLPFRGVDIGAPPPSKAEAGRANRKVRAVLYCAESEQTAVAEVRPARGFWVSIGQLRTLKELRLLDVVDGIPTLYPFTDETVAWSVQFSQLLQSFAEALSTPLARDDDIADYLPSQKLCEYVERLRYDGVRYPSAMQDDGVNVVLFDPSKAEVLDSNLVEVTSVKVTYHPRGFLRK